MTGKEGLHPCRFSTSVGVRVGTGLLHGGITPVCLYLVFDVVCGECCIDWET